jgi:hypothetical protein
MKLRNTILLIVISAGYCLGQTGKDSVVSFGAFSLRVPPNWKTIKQQGIDSYVGGLTNGTDTLQFDYGRYSFKPRRKEDECRISFRLQAGRVARYAKQQEPGKGTTAIYIRKKRRKFVLYGINLRNEKEALKIMRSVKFTRNK